MDAVGLNITVWGGLVLGVFLGAFVSVVVARRFQWAMPTGAQMLRNVADGVMMAWGGILTMGCSIGHGIGHGMAWHGMAWRVWQPCRCRVSSR